MSEVSEARPPAATAKPARLVAVAQSGWRWLPLTAGVIVADQLVKAWIVHHFALFERVHVLGVLDIILT
jgi:lipoprotein signal peptidase